MKWNELFSFYCMDDLGYKRNSASVMFAFWNSWLSAAELWSDKKKLTQTGRKLWKDVSPCRTPRRFPTKQTPSAHQAPLYSEQETTRKENKVRKATALDPQTCAISSSTTSTCFHFKSLKRSHLYFYEFCLKMSLKTSRSDCKFCSTLIVSPLVQINWETITIKLVAQVILGQHGANLKLHTQTSLKHCNVASLSWSSSSGLACRHKPAPQTDPEWLQPGAAALLIPSGRFPDSRSA